MKRSVAIAILAINSEKHAGAAVPMTIDEIGRRIDLAPERVRDVLEDWFGVVAWSDRTPALTLGHYAEMRHFLGN